MGYHSNPKFVDIPGTSGQLALYHYPAKKHAIVAKNAGCIAIVTLQDSKEDAKKKVKSFCEKLDMEWIQIDFWGCFYKEAKYPQLIVTLQKVKHLLEEGLKVMVHCAAGIHRTGMFAFALLRMIGHDYEFSYNYLRTLRPSTREHVGEDRIKRTELFLKRNKLLPSLDSAVNEQGSGKLDNPSANVQSVEVRDVKTDI